MNIHNKSNIAFVHDWLTTMGGSELVLSSMLEIWQDAPVYTMVYKPDGPCRDLVNDHVVFPSFIQKLPKAQRKHQGYLPLMPLAVEQFDLSAYPVVISSSHAVAKGILTGPDQLHISYVHSPIRYAWDLQHQYLREAHLTKGIRSALARMLLHYIRLWDQRTANGVDVFVANSRFIARRIRKVYGREAQVIYPPVDVNAFTLHSNKENFYLTVSRVVPYKRIDLIVDAFTKMPDKHLIVIGDGPYLNDIKSNAGPNVEFLGFQPSSVLRDYMQRAKAFVFAAEEDFGIVPVEAQACGTPVIAFGKGGSLETVIEGETGIFFFQQSVESLITAVQEFEKCQGVFHALTIREHAEKFSKERFKQEFLDFVNQAWDWFQGADKTQQNMTVFLEETLLRK